MLNVFVSNETTETTELKISEAKAWVDLKCSTIAQKLARDYGAPWKIDSHEMAEAIKSKDRYVNRLLKSDEERLVYAALKWSEETNRYELNRCNNLLDSIDVQIYMYWTNSSSVKGYQNPRAVFFSGGIPGTGKRR